MLKNVQKRMKSGKYVTSDFRKVMARTPRGPCPRAFLLLSRPFPQGYPAGRTPANVSQSHGFTIGLYIVILHDTLHRETFIAKLADIQQSAGQLLAELQASEHDAFASHLYRSRHKYR